MRRQTYDTIAGDRIYRNDLSASGKFTDVSKEAGIYQSNLGYGLGLAIADMNNDGWDDIYVGNDFHENDYYYINTATAHLLKVVQNTSGITAVSVWAMILTTTIMTDNRMW